MDWKLARVAFPFGLGGAFAWELAGDTKSADLLKAVATGLR